MDHGQAVQVACFRWDCFLVTQTGRKTYPRAQPVQLDQLSNVARSLCDLYSHPSVVSVHYSRCLHYHLSAFSDQELFDSLF